MRRTAFALCTVALFSIGATSSTDCLSTLLPILTPPVTISIHVTNKAYEPVSVQILGGNTTTTLAAADLATATQETPATQPAGASTVDSGQDIKLTTLPCLALPDTIALEATMGDITEGGQSAVSAELHYDSNFACGDRINFIVRPAARVGFVVGYEVIKGAAD